MADKPNIQDVCDTFHKFRISMLASQMPHISQVQAWKEKQRENQAALKADLDKMGLGDSIDWTERD